jgi:glycosyltransferase involved in cell wall biosynthesis
VIGLAVGDTSKLSRPRFGQWMRWDPGQDAAPPVAREVLPTSIIVCSGLIERLPDPAPLLGTLHQLMEYAPVGIITTPDRDVVRGPDHPASPEGLGSVREWNREEFRVLLEAAGLRVEFIGLTAGDDVHFHRDTTLAILANNHAPAIEEAPAHFRVVAPMTVYNEEDIIVPSLTYLIDQGVEVYLIDNWSTDRTVELARPFQGRGVIGLEQFPPEGPSPTYDWARLLNRIEEVTTEIEANWYMHTDPDEIRRSPWPGVRLKDALYHVDRSGFNAVDHTPLSFRAIDNGYPDGSDLEQYFQFFDFDFVQDNQVKTWKNTGLRVLLDYAGHSATFAGRRIYPYNFLFKHYPIRSQDHGERKVFRERRARYNPGERQDGWHRHYDPWSPGDTFLFDPSKLLRFDESGFDQAYLVERLANIGPQEQQAWVVRGTPGPTWRMLAHRSYRRIRRLLSPMRRLVIS